MCGVGILSSIINMLITQQIISNIGLQIELMYNKSI